MSIKGRKSPVSRSVYQAQSERLKQVLADLKTITFADKNNPEEVENARRKFVYWRKFFMEEENFNMTLRDMLSTKYGETKVKVSRHVATRTPKFDLNEAINMQMGNIKKHDSEHGC